MRRRLARSALALAALVVCVSAAQAADWARYGYDAQRSNAAASSSGLAAGDVGHLRRQQVRLPGTVDSSPIYLHDVTVKGRRRDVAVVTTTYGITLAVDAARGAVLWRFAPAAASQLAGSPQITTATPVADPDRRYVYAASPDGRVHKLRLADGREVRAGGWPVTVTLLPRREKIASALNVSGSLLLVTTGGYFGDAPPYQGHVVAIERTSGRILHVFNALCSDRHRLLEPSSCGASDAAIWARAGAVVEPGSQRLLVATGNGPWDGRSDFGDSVLELSPDAGRLLQAYTPLDTSRLEADDQDLGSTAPALLPPARGGRRLAVQGGKDGVLRVLDLARLNGRTRSPAPIRGGEVSTASSPGGGVFTTPAVWRHDGRTWVFVTTFQATGAYVLVDGARPRLRLAWRTQRPGTSPVLAGGLLYVYDPDGGLAVYRPTSPHALAVLSAGRGHWNSPVVADGRILLPEGDANDHASSGVLDIFRR